MVTLNYSDVSASLVNYELKMKDKQSSSNGTSAEALTVRGRGSNLRVKASMGDRNPDQILEI